MYTLPALTETSQRRIDKHNRFPALVRSAHAVIDAGLTEYRVRHVWALFSGGHDSLTATHVASQHPAFAGVIHIDTGTGVPETEQYVRDICARYGWRLMVGKPATTYQQLIVEHGFPGPPQHGIMYRYLKERPLDQVRIGIQRECGEKIAFVGGMRSQESSRRMGNAEPHHQDRHGIWVSAIHNWTAMDVSTYVHLNALPRNQVKRNTHMSGECLCSAFAKQGEAQMYEYFYPDVAERIRRWETLVQQARELQVWEAEHGFRAWADVMDQKHTVWGFRTAVPASQMELLPMCWACTADQASNDISAAIDRDPTAARG